MDKADSLDTSTISELDFDIESPKSQTRKRKRSLSPPQIDEIMTDERMHTIEKYAYRILLQMKNDDGFGLSSISSTYNSQSDDEMDQHSTPSKSYDMHSFDIPFIKRRRVY